MSVEIAEKKLFLKNVIFLFNLKKKLENYSINKLYLS